MANSGLNGTQEDLVKDIMGVLNSAQGMEYARIEVEIPDEDGNMSTKKLPLAGGDGGVSYKTMPNIKTGGGVSGSGVSGTEALAAIIVDKTISHIIENFEVAWHDRIEALETDFNTFVANMLTAGTALSASATVPPGGVAPGGALVIAACTGVKGPARAAKSAADMALEGVKSMGTNVL